MLFRAHDELDIDLAQSYMIGDRYLDVDVAHAAGVKSILVMTGNGRAELEKYKNLPLQPHLVAENLLEAVDSIISGLA